MVSTPRIINIGASAKVGRHDVGNKIMCSAVISKNWLHRTRPHDSLVPRWQTQNSVTGNGTWSHFLIILIHQLVSAQRDTTFLFAWNLFVFWPINYCISRLWVYFTHNFLFPFQLPRHRGRQCLYVLPVTPPSPNHSEVHHEFCLQNPSLEPKQL